MNFEGEKKPFGLSEPVGVPKTQLRPNLPTRRCVGKKKKKKMSAFRLLSFRTKKVAAFETPSDTLHDVFLLFGL
jgi:hypothetical protein